MYLDHKQKLSDKIVALLCYVIALQPLVLYLFLQIMTYSKGAEYHKGFILVSLLFIFMSTIVRGSSLGQIRIPVYLRLVFLYVIYIELHRMIIDKYSIFDFFYELVTNVNFVSFVILLVIENTIITERVYNNIQNLLFGLIIFSAIVTGIQVTHNQDFFIPPEYIGRSTAFMGDMLSYRFPSIYAMLGSFDILCEFPALVALSLDRKDHYRKYGNILILLASAFVVIFEKTRITMINYLVAILNFILQKKIVFMQFVRFVLLIFVIIGLAVLLSNQLHINVHELIEKRIMSNSAMTRLVAFEVFAKQFPSNPVFGTGGVKEYDMIRDLSGRSSQIHVGFLSILYYYGLGGGALFISILILLLNRFIKIAKRAHIYGPLLALICFILVNFTHVFLSFYHMFFFILIIFARYYELRLEEQENITEKTTLAE